MIYAGTGHRPDKLLGFTEAGAKPVRALARSYFERVGDATEVITGMALGWDWAVAQAALELGIPLTAAVPFKGQENIWPPETRSQYQDILARATRVVIVSEGPMAKWKFLKRNVWMVDNCEKLVALWDGSEGGTAHCMEYAGKVGRRFDNLWDEYLKIR